MTITLPRPGTLVALCLLIGLLTGGTTSCERSPRERQVEMTTAPAPLSSEDQERVTRFAEEFAAAVSSGHGQTVARAFDLDTLVDYVLGPLDLGTELAAFKSEVRSAAQRQHGGLASGFMGHRYRFLRFVEEEGETRLLFRDTSDRGFDYHKYRFYLDPQDRVRLTDFYVFTNGEYLSATTRRMVLPVLEHLAKGRIARIFGGGDERRVVQDVERLQVAQQKLLAGDIVGAKESLKSLSREFRREKVARLAELAALGQATEDEPAYARALEAFARDFRGDPCVPLQMIDFYFMKGDYAKLLEIVDDLDRMVGGDVYLNLYRAIALHGMGKPEEGLRLLDPAIVEEPDEDELRWTAAECAVGAKKYAEASRHFDVLEDQFGYEITEEFLREVPEYADYLASPEGQRRFGKGH